MKFDKLFDRSMVLETAGPAVLPAPVRTKPGTLPTPSAPPAPKRPDWLPTPTTKPRPKALVKGPFDEEDEEDTLAPVTPAASIVAKHDYEVYNKRKHKKTITQ